MSSQKNSRVVHYESIPMDASASLTLREFNWPSFPFNWHYHPEVELTLIIRGGGMRFVGDSCEEFADGDLCLLGANVPHCWVSHKDSDPGVRSLVTHFRPDTWGEEFWKLPELRVIAKLLDKAQSGLNVRGAARRQVEKLFVILQQEPHGSLRRFDALLEILHIIAESEDARPLAVNVRDGTTAVEASGKLGKILGYIHAHLGPDLTQKEVADAVRLSPAAFSQFFRRSLGTPYVDYINEIKIRNASRALLDTDQPITEIAYSAGFNNLSHFNAQFRRFRNLSPRTFRQQALVAERAGIPIGIVSTLAPTSAATAVNFKHDITVHGKGTVFEGVRLGTEEPRPWLKHYGVCSELARYGIMHAGVTEAHAPYQIVRTNQTTSYFLACFGGRGHVLVDGQWREIRPGLACLLPAHLNTAFEALPGEPWRFTYVCYQEYLEQPPKTSVSSPVVAEFNSELLRLAIQGLTAECNHRTDAALENCWLELMQGYVQAFAHPNPKTSPLPKLWQWVATRLKDPWSLDSLARKTGCSRESLRRLCLRELGRSPQQHLISLRMRRATELLATTQLSLNKIATMVGYPNPLIFSNIFKSNVGCRPSEYRKRAGSSE